MMKARRILVFVCAAAYSGSAYAAVPITGRWLTGGGKGVVEIGPCGPSLCGKIIKLIANPNGPPVDRNNPNPALRSRPLVGLNILSAFKDAGKRWEGQIYDPEGGKSYRSLVARNPDGTLSVKGCIAFFCQTQTWKPLK
jgi:uncharacterized protein (DUF2147 family)